MRVHLITWKTPAAFYKAGKVWDLRASFSEPPKHRRAHRSSRLLPTQMRPPWRGAGLLQLRWRTWNPIPQVVLHRAHDDHVVHAPFLAGWEETETDDL